MQKIFWYCTDILKRTDDQPIKNETIIKKDHKTIALYLYRALIFAMAIKVYGLQIRGMFASVRN